MRYLLFLLPLLCTCDRAPLSDRAEDRTITLSRTDYADRLAGFWLGQCIANWTGLVTEMDKIGNIGELQTGAFYTRDDWGAPDQPSIWGEGVPSDLSATIDFVFVDPDSIWGADDDTDIEYLYQYLLDSLGTTRLTPQQIRDGWLKHIASEEENYLWVANQRAYDLMEEGVLPPETGDLNRNEHYDMIDAQLTTELFGLYAPLHPDVALQLADLPIRTVARGNAAHIADFYVVMYALAPGVERNRPLGPQLLANAERARTYLPDTSYAAKMYDVALAQYRSGQPWEATRDSLYQRYQVDQRDGYELTARELYCNGCFAAGINFAASLVSLFYGEGDLKETIKIGSLAGWDSDNPTATWGGMIGFILGEQGVEDAFGRSFSDRYDIHRTRRNFPNDGIDTFGRMAERGVAIVDRVVVDELGGKRAGDTWTIPLPVLTED
ncbi:hypothetical protein LEM8419_03397 [Neolewinella maritima]|uniref:ADP-ribosylglycohydrolase family protein n=1 Tax=Neolewinella maritima TaxID=1383882 RepID=A0ABM9B5D4_9BACT|nr:ADP-ribosylglycohydrolase family protein [Neolewinella maritima]CAH1002518.1 hypothetical protein LEM8419_03397 [Neolewinella maritima]